MWDFKCLGRPGDFLQYVLEISAVNIPLLRVFFSCFHEQNKYKIRAFARCRNHTKKFINLKVGKHLLALKCTFLGSKLAKHLQSVVDEKEKLPCLLFTVLDTNLWFRNWIPIWMLNLMHSTIFDKKIFTIPPE